MHNRNITPDRENVNTLLAKGLKRCREASDNALNAFRKASNPANGDEGSGGDPGTTITGCLERLTGTAGSSDSPSPSYVQYSDLQGITSHETGVITSTFLVDGVKLQNLLRPKHEYYADKWGSVASISSYEDEDEGKRLLYPKVRAVHRENPYRKMQLRRQTTGRTTKTMFALIENRELADFRVADLTFTYPREVSAYLAKQVKRGRDAAWRMEAKLWSELEAVGLYSSGMARSVNLHVWKTENPLQPHFHFHEMFLNYECTFAEVSETSETPPPDYSDDFRDYMRGKHKQYADEVLDGIAELPHAEATFTKRPWDTGSGGSGGPWTKGQLHTVKSVWTMVVKRFTRKHGIKCPVFSDPEATLDVHVDFIRLDSEMGRVRFMHKLNYKARHWSEDYAKYSNEHTECKNPPDWLLHYDNRTRVFGWWGKLKVLAGPLQNDKEKLSPYTGKKMTYTGKYDGDTGLDTLLEASEGRLFCVEFIRGRPVESEYSPSDVAWLRSVCMTRDDGMAWRHNPPESMDLQGITSFESGQNNG